MHFFAYRMHAGVPKGRIIANPKTFQPIIHTLINKVKSVLKNYVHWRGSGPTNAHITNAIR